jgi:hypothetical protein
MKLNISLNLEVTISLLIKIISSSNLNFVDDNMVKDYTLNVDLRIFN